MYFDGHLDADGHFFDPKSDLLVAIPALTKKLAEQVLFWPRIHIAGYVSVCLNLHTMGFRGGFRALKNETLWDTL